MVKPHTSINKKGIILSTKAAIPNMGSAETPLLDNIKNEKPYSANTKITIT